MLLPGVEAFNPRKVDFHVYNGASDLGTAPLLIVASIQGPRMVRSPLGGPE